MKNLTNIIALIALCGCARFTTKQTDISSTNPYGQPTRTITTKASATTFWDSTSALAKFKASQTDKSQSATVGTLEQSASSTNVDQIIGVVVGAAIKAAIKP